jgi:hypothetical protein
VADPLVKDLAYGALAASLGNRLTRESASTMLGGLTGQPPVEDFLASIGAQRRALTPIEEAARSLQDVPVEPDYRFQSIQNLSPQQSMIDQALQNLQISGQYGSIDDADGYQFGGRVGYNFPVGDNRLNLGVTGSGYSVDTPFGKFGDRQISGGDLSFQSGQNTFGASYDRMGSIPGDIGSPLQNLFRLTYQRQFE